MTRPAAPEMRRVPFNVLAPGVEAIRSELDEAIARVLDRGYFLLGPELESFEQEFAAYHGADLHSVGVGSGTDALTIGLRALGVQPGDDVLVTANAGIPPVAAVVAAGGRPVFCDVDPQSHTLDPAEIERRVTSGSKAVVVVHLYGHVADMEPILNAAREHGLKVLEDCAQAHGARYGGRRVGTFGDAAAFSFYPTKNLGALGDAGAVVTADPSIADRAKLLRMYGWRQRYVSEIHSTVSRMDELQAAMLRVKLPHLDGWNEKRQALAQRYHARLKGLVELPPSEGVFHLFVIQIDQRERVKAYLAEHGVATDIHYPVPAHVQKPYAAFASGPLPNSERLAARVLSLPLYPELDEQSVDYVARTLGAYGA